MLPSIRQTNLLIFLACTALMLVAFYLEYVEDMEPCALCMTQRIFIVAVGLMALFAFLHNPAQRGRRIYAILGIVLAIAGGYFSSRQLWLQSLPEDQVPACGPNLYYMLDVFPFKDTLKSMLVGDGNCAEIDRFLGVTIPLWTLLAFIGFALVNFYQSLRRQ
jgi:disulfide bond formation protein DsbB